MDNPEGEDLRRSLPIIGSETIKSFYAEIELMEPSQTDQTIKDIDQFVISQAHQAAANEKKYKMQDNVKDMSRGVFMDLADVNPRLVRAIKGVMDSDYMMKAHEDFYTTGMAVVLRIFDMQQDYGLIERFGVLDEEDVASIKEELGKSLKSGEGTILEQALSAPRIPFQQVSLNGAIQTLNRLNSSLFGQQFKAGTVAMHDVLAHNWSKLHSQHQPPSQG